MYLSLLTLDLSSPSVRQAIRDCQDLHRNIMKAFDVGRKDASVLYRMIRSDKTVQLYVQSEAFPNWDRITENGFLCVKQKDISAVFQSFHSGQILHFQLLGCPTKKVSGEGKNSRRVMLRGEDSQMNWLRRQGEKNGFSVLEACISAKNEVLSGKKQSGEFFLSGVPFEGVLRIEDESAFCTGFREGIGAEKAYGFGMLMLRKMP